MSRPFRALLAVLAALALTIGIAGSAAAAVGSTTNVLGSGLNRVADTRLSWTTTGSYWYIDSGQDVRVWNPTGNQHGLLYAAVYFPAAATYVSCAAESGAAKTDDYFYMGAITDGNTKIAACTMGNAPSTANVRVQIQSVGESGGIIATWCVSIRHNYNAVAAGNC